MKNFLDFLTFSWNLKYVENSNTNIFLSHLAVLVCVHQPAPAAPNSIPICCALTWYWPKNECRVSERKWLEFKPK